MSSFDTKSVILLVTSLNLQYYNEYFDINIVDKLLWHDYWDEVNVRYINTQNIP